MHRETDYKKTHNRKAVLEILENAENPLTAEDIFIQLKHNSVSVALSTIYRALETLMQSGEITKSFQAGTSKARYELRQHRHYFTCNICKKMIPLSNCPLEEAFNKLQDHSGFEITDHSLALYGKCADCKNMLS